MATLYITEFCVLGNAGGTTIPAATLPALANQTRTVSSTSAQSSAVNAQTNFVRLQSDVDCFVLAGTNPTALTTSMPLTAYAPEYFAVPANASIKIAAITA